ncbi:MAG TPA: glycosyltransferase [Candidatus Mediterraneibacter faecavium]|uniref:Glycosyltransferase n=1 Tax=Candidatus Mediterraneibacter faecavium TaxID=2838668 RepID=A0A9D2QAJ7_9FIRM|nr:glycosyltransferase [Candidatus Mediterraneibacter faecavium]
MKLVSVIIPAYNAEKTIARCLQSVINASYQNLEVIVVDDGSTDKTASICQNYAEKDRRIKVICQSNLGVVEARKLALYYSTGEYISFVDSDDTMSVKMIEKLTEAMELKYVDIAVCGYEVVWDDHLERAQYEKEVTLGNTYDILDAYINGGVRGFLWNKLYKRELFEDMQWPENMDICEDLYSNAWIVSKHPDLKVTILPESYYQYYMYESSATHNIEKLISPSGEWKYLTAHRLIEELFIGDPQITRMLKISEAVLIQYGIQMLSGGHDFSETKRALKRASLKFLFIMLKSEKSIREKIKWIYDCFL